MKAKKTLTKELMEINNSIFAAKAENTLQYIYEKELAAALGIIFRQMKEEIIKNLQEYYSTDVMLKAHMDLILAPIHEYHKAYYNTLMKFKLREYKKGQVQGKRLVNRAKQYAKNYSKIHGAIKEDTIKVPGVNSVIKKGELFGTSDYSSEQMTNKTFVASEKTLARVDSDINGIITKGYEDGMGINDVGQRIQKRFQNFETWEANRIARTEIHGSHMLGVMQSYQDMGVEYTQWSTAHDSRVRGLNPGDKADHVKMDGEIIPMGGVYSNGLKYPGDTNGPLREFINCRCGNLPFIMPPGYAAPPGMSQFKESDLIKVEDITLEEKLLPQPEEVLNDVPNILTDLDPISNREVNVYDYGKYKVAFDKDVKHLTPEEIKAHLDSLPNQLTDNIDIIRINNWYAEKGVQGEFSAIGGRSIRLYNVGPKTSKVDYLDALTHELAHSVDIKKAGQHTLANPKVYERIFKADNKLYRVKNERTGRFRTPKKFPTDYAARSYAKYKKLKADHKLFAEDFAESTKLYLNPKSHKKFVKDFPNRAKYLEGIYGKPTFNKDAPLSKAIEDLEKMEKAAEAKMLARQKAVDESKKLDEKLKGLSDDELDIRLKRVLDDDKHVKAYHRMKKELTKMESVPKAVSYDDINILTDGGWDTNTAKKIMSNPNSFLPKVRQQRDQINEILGQVDELIKQDLKANPTIKVKPKVTPKSKVTSPKATKLGPSKTKLNITPKVKSTTHDVYEGTYEGLKSVEYEDGTKILFKKAPSADPDYPFQTLDKVTINGKTYKYLDTKDVYSHFKYQDDLLTKEELKFADEFIEKYGTYAGQEFNTYKRGRLSKKDFDDIKDDEAFKWLNDNFEKYNKILDKSVIKGDTVTMRIQAKNYIPKGTTHIQDKGYTSTSASKPRTGLIDCFGNGRDLDDNWTYITVTPDGTTGARFQGNSIARTYGSLDDDFEQEITYKPDMEFDILLRDDANKIMILTPGG